MNNKKLVSEFFLVFALLFLAGQALAICTGPLVPCGQEGNPCQFCHLFVLFDNIIKFVLTCFAPIVAVLMIVIAGLLFIFSSGRPEIFAQAKSIITAVVIGLVIIFIAWLLVNLFFSVIGVESWTGLQSGWFKINCQ
jgi:type IV secretory pathway VirB2 component (pilin)